ncbi:MAG TPA: hypothetical protein VN881_08280 [Candidatus Acidoferrales bacterium]|nr:hypothetical protein [Candidatus Acidoferrales bacterium]
MTETVAAPNRFKRVFDFIPTWLAEKTLRMAMVMAVVAIFGAVTAFQAGKAELDASLHERMLQHGQLLELKYWQEYLTDLSQFDKYFATSELYYQESLSRKGKADELRRDHDTAGAAFQDLDSQERSARGKSQIPFYDSFYGLGWPYKDAKSLPERKLQQSIAETLAGIGFETNGPQQCSIENAGIWGGLECEIKAAQGRVKRLAVAVVLLVISLALFTFAQLYRAKARVVIWLIRLACLTAVAGLLLSVWNDVDSWKVFGRYSVVIAALMVLGYWLSTTTKIKDFFLLDKEVEEDEVVHAGEIGPHSYCAEHVHIGMDKHRFHVWIVAAIAITASLSAIDGVLYSVAGIHQSETASEALRYQMDMVKNSTRRVAQNNLTLQGLAYAQEFRTQYRAGQQELELVRNGVPGANRQAATLAMEPWQDFIDREENQPLPALLDGPEGPDSDTFFPRRLMARDLTTEQTDFAKWDGENEISLAWNQASTRYLRALTFFAIALYLFGQALSMGRTQEAFILFCCASFLAFAGLCWMAGVTYIDTRIPHVDQFEKAAALYGQGMEKFKTASTSEEYGNAVSDFAESLKQRHTFALANYYLALSLSNQMTPQKEGYQSLHFKQSLPDIVDKEEQAIDALAKENLTPPLGFLLDHGYDSTDLGLTQKRRELVEHGIDEEQKALARDGDDTMLLFNTGMGLLADGPEKKSEGLATYDKGVASLVKSDDRMRLAAGVITDLEILRKYCLGLNTSTYCDDIGREVDKEESRLSIAAWMPPDWKAPVNSSNSQISDLKLFASPAGLGWEARVPMDLGDNGLVVVWYACDTGYPGKDACDSKTLDTGTSDANWGVWWVLTGISGRVRPDDLLDKGNGKQYAFKSALQSSSVNSCLPPGEFRAEFYLNGQRLDFGSSGKVSFGADSSKPGSQFKPTVLRDLDLEMCYPKNWKNWTFKNTTDPGLIAGYVDPADSGSGAFLFTYYYPQPDDNSTSSAKTALVEKSLKVLASEGLISQSGMSREPDACDNYVERPNVTRARYRSSENTVLSKVWFANDGIAHVGLVFRRNSGAQAFQGSGTTENSERESCDVLATIRIYYVTW